MFQNVLQAVHEVFGFVVYNLLSESLAVHMLRLSQETRYDMLLISGMSLQFAEHFPKLRSLNP